jgi:hypothetical protein
MGDTLKDTYPQLFSFTTKPKCSIRYFMDQETNRKFILPLSTQAAVQFEELQSLLLERVWDIAGHTLGDLEASAVERLTKFSLDTHKHLLSSLGFGPQAIWASINSSSGCC